MEINSIFEAKVLAANYLEVVSNRIPYLGEGLFPANKKAGLDLKWIRGNKGLPISLMPSAFDAQATYRDRIGISKLETEMPFFREGFKIKEKDRQDIMRAQDSNDPYVQSVLNFVFDDTYQLIEGAMVAAERMRMQLLFPVSGGPNIAILANGVDYTYNYDPDGAWAAANRFTLTGDALWSAAATSNPMADMETVKNAILNATGTELRVAVMNSVTFNYMVQSTAIKNRWLATNGLGVGYTTKNELRQAFEGVTGVRIALYDKQYKNESGVAAKFVPDGLVAMIPEGSIGNTWYGTTPEEADGVNTALVNTGVALTTVKIPHPVNTNIITSEIVLPSYERMDEVALLKVLA